MVKIWKMNFKDTQRKQQTAILWTDRPPQQYLQ